MTAWVGIGELAAMGTALLWTLSALAWTSAGKDMGALAVSFLRLVITCPLLLGYGWLVRGLWTPSDASNETWLTLGVSGFIGFFLADLCYIKALLLIGPRLTLLLQALAPPLTAFASWFVLGDHLSTRSWLAMGATLAGVSWVVMDRPNHREQAPARNLGWGVVLAVLAAAGQALGLALSKKGIGDYDAVAATFIRIAGAMGGYLVLITLLRRWPAMIAAARHAPAMAVTSLGALVGPFAGVALSMVAVRHCHAAVAATIIGTTPVLVLPFVELVYRESVSFRATGGAVLSVAGVALLLLR